MKILAKILKIISLLLFIIAVLIGFARNGYLDRPIKSLVKQYFHYKNIDIVIADFHIHGSRIEASRAIVKLSDEAIVNIDNFSAKINLKKAGIFSTSHMNFNITDQALLPVIKGVSEIKYKYKFFGKTSIELNLSKITGFTAVGEENNSGKCVYKKTKLEQIVNCKLDVGDNSNLNLNSFITQNDKISAELEVNNIPIALYKIIQRFAVSHEVIIFLDEFIKEGKIDSGWVKLDSTFESLKKGEITPENLNGKFALSNIELDYFPDFPNLKNIQLAVELLGTKSKFTISQAHLNDTIIDGRIDFDWRGFETTNVIVEANAAGPVVDLIDFIPAKSLERAKKDGIDLKTIQGMASTLVNIVIPLNPKVKNSYKISTDLTKINLKLFNNAINLTQAELKGNFDGDEIIIKGTGQINGSISDIEYRYMLENVKEYDSLIKIKTKLKASNQSLGLFNVKAGSADLDFICSEKADKYLISASSDLKGIEFYLDKISILKKIGEKANLSIAGSIVNNSTNVDFKLIGDNNLNISGNIVNSNNQEKTITLNNITYNKTNISGEIIYDNDNFKATIKGSYLDLADSDLMKFLEKEDNSLNTNIKVKVDRLRLKNNVCLDDFSLKIKCDKVRCYSGYLDSKVGTKFLKMLLKTFKDYEEWVITSSNAGAVLKALDLYKNMKSGSMLLILNTKRQEAQSGQVVPILDGSYTFRKFVITDTPFLTRIVSFISLPGFLNFMRNNQDIAFYEMNGNFSFNDKVISISKGVAEGPFFDFNITGAVDTANKQVNLKGQVIPSLYGISAIVKRVPILGKIITGNNNRGVISAPFKIEQKY